MNLKAKIIKKFSLIGSFLGFTTVLLKTQNGTVVQADTLINNNQNFKTVTITENDCLWNLSQKYGVSMEEIVKANPSIFVNGINSTIYVGQQVKIPNNSQETTQHTDQGSSSYNSSQQSNIRESASNQQNLTEEQAKNWISQRESGNDYNARNGRYIGKYQLDYTYLQGDYSPQHQEQVANAYVITRYGSWTEAKTFWENHGWY